MKKIAFIFLILIIALPGLSFCAKTIYSDIYYTHPETNLARDTIKENHYSRYTRSYLPPVLFSDSSANYKNIVKFTPLKPFGVFNPSVEIGYERKTGRGYSSQVMVSLLLGKNIWHSNKGVGPRGYRFGFEERYFFPHKKHYGSYFGLEVDYLNSYRKAVAFFTESVIDSLQLPVTYKDTFGLQKNFIEANLKFGIQKVWGHFVLDAYCGIGVRYRTITHSGRKNPKDEPVPPRMFQIRYDTGSLTVPSMPLNFRIGWTF